MMCSQWLQTIASMALVFCIHLQSSNANHIHNHHNSHNAPHSTNWLRTEVLDANGLFVLDWRKSGKDIIFRATVNSRGYIGLGFTYKSEKIGDADIILAWVDDQTGEPNVLVSEQKNPHSQSIRNFDLQCVIQIVGVVASFGMETMGSLSARITYHARVHQIISDGTHRVYSATDAFNSFHADGYIFTLVWNIYAVYRIPMH